MNEAVFLALLGIVSAGGTYFGRWVFTRLDDLQKQVTVLFEQNNDLEVQNAVLKHEKNILMIERDRLQLQIVDLAARIAELERQLATKPTRRRTAKVPA